MNIVEWGTEFPVSINIQSILYGLTHKFKKLRSFIRALHAILFLYEDSSILVLPIQSLQTRQSLQHIQQFINQQGNTQPNQTYLYSENTKTAIVTILSLQNQDELPVFLVFKENFTYDFISVDQAHIHFKPNIPMTIRDGLLKYVEVQCDLITIVTQPEPDSHPSPDDEQPTTLSFTIYSGVFSMDDYSATSWALQSVIDEVPHFIYSKLPTLYVLKHDGLYGCSLDNRGYRRFPRPLTPIKLDNDLIQVKSLQGFYLYDKKTKLLYLVRGKSFQEIIQIHSPNEIIEVIIMGSRVITLTEESIDVFDSLSGDLVHKCKVEKTDHWVVSVDPSYGLVFSGTKNYTVSKTEIPPTLNLYADKDELMEQMMKVKKTVGTVAAPILLLSNRSAYLAATLLADEINEEVSQPVAEGSMQAQVKQTIEKLNHLLHHRPDVNNS